MASPAEWGYEYAGHLLRPLFQVELTNSGFVDVGPQHSHITPNSRLNSIGSKESSLEKLRRMMLHENLGWHVRIAKKLFQLLLYLLFLLPWISWKISLSHGEPIETPGKGGWCLSIELGAGIFAMNIFGLWLGMTSDVAWWWIIIQISFGLAVIACTNLLLSMVPLLHRRCWWGNKYWVGSLLSIICTLVMLIPITLSMVVYARLSGINSLSISKPLADAGLITPEKFANKVDRARVLAARNCQSDPFTWTNDVATSNREESTVRIGRGQRYMLDLSETLHNPRQVINGSDRERLIARRKALVDALDKKEL